MSKRHTLLFVALISGCTTQQTLAPTPQPARQQIAPKSESLHISIGSLSGLPQSHVKPLRNQLTAKGLGADILVQENPKQQVDYRLDGTFGAIQQVSGTLISYRWSVVDSTGAAVHSFLGTVNTDAGSASPWSSVSEKAMEQMALQTITTLKAWHRRR